MFPVLPVLPCLQFRLARNSIAVFLELLLILRYNFSKLLIYQQLILKGWVQRLEIRYETDGVYADSQLRNPQFIMTGHHCHNCYELYYVENGDCRFLTKNHLDDLHAGDFILIPPMTLHYTRYVFGSCKRTVILFRREDISEDVLQMMPRGEDFLSETRRFHVPEAYLRQVSECLRQIVLEEKLADARSPLMRRSFFQILLLLCSRVCLFPSESPGNIHTTDQQIVQTACFIHANYMLPITSSDIAQAIGFSPNHLSRKFRRATGVGLHEYLVFVRLDHAAQELISTEDSITAIALRCGFSDSNYFKDSFKKKYGVTPRAYRKIR